jgi:hypothetical protein
LKPKEVLLAIAPLISRERREKMDLGAKGGPAARSPKGGPTVSCHVGGWVGGWALPSKAARLLGQPQKLGGHPKRGASP